MLPLIYSVVLWGLLHKAENQKAEKSKGRKPKGRKSKGRKPKGRKSKGRKSKSRKTKGRKSKGRKWCFVVTAECFPIWKCSLSNYAYTITVYCSSLQVNIRSRRYNEI